MTAPKRPGGWVDGIGWVCDLRQIPDGAWFVYDPERPEKADVGDQAWRESAAHPEPIIVTRWADGTIPEAPKKPDTAMLRLVAAEMRDVGGFDVDADLVTAAADYIDGAP